MGSYRLVKLINPINLGLDLTATGAYDNATPYSAGDSVSYNGSSYVATQATTGNLPTDTAFWQLLAEKGETGADSTVPGPMGPQGEQGLRGLQGEKGDKGDKGDPGLDGADAVAGKLPSSYVELSAPVGTTSATLEDVTGMSTTITLDEAVEIAVISSFEIATQSGAAASTIGIAININGTDYDSYERYLSGLNDKGIGSIIHRSGELAPGTYTVKLRFQRVSGTATPGLNHADMLVMAMQGAKGEQGLQGLQGVKGDQGDPGLVTSITAGTGISVDSTDPSNPIVSNTQTSAVWGSITGTLSGQTDLQTALDGKVNDTGDETIAGIKTFSSDPIIPDEAYGSGWDGVFEPPTKNALYDKIETLVSGGQTTYDAIVAPTGGTHTTLGAALTAASNGWRILVAGNTTEEGAISSALTDLVIDGTGGGGVVSSAYSITLSGARLLLNNLNIALSTGALSFSGEYQKLTNNNITYSSVTGDYKFDMAGLGSIFTGNTITDTSSTGNYHRVRFSGNYQRITANHFVNLYAPSGRNMVTLGGYYQIFNGNNIKLAGTASANNNTVAVSNAYIVVANNSLDCAGKARGISASSGITNLTITGNYIYTPNDYGIHLNTSSGNEYIVTGNYIQMSSNATHGIYSDGTRTVITGNLISNGGSVGASINGIRVTGSKCTIVGNTIKSFGVGILTSAASSTIVGNTIEACTIRYRNDNSAPDLDTNTSPEAPLKDNRLIVSAVNISGGSLSSGNVVVYGSTTDSDGVTTTTTAGDPRVLGMMYSSPSNNAYGTVVTQGYVTVLKVNGTADIAVGDYLSTHTVAGIAAKASAGHTAFAIAKEAYTADDSNGVIDALLIPPRII